MLCVIFQNATVKEYAKDIQEISRKGNLSAKLEYNVCKYGTFIFVFLIKPFRLWL